MCHLTFHSADMGYIDMLNTKLVKIVLKKITKFSDNDPFKTYPGFVNGVMFFCENGRITTKLMLKCMLVIS